MLKFVVCDISRIRIDELYASQIGTFGAEEKERIERFKREEDRHRALIREIMLSDILKERFGEVPPLLKNEYGKPYVDTKEDFEFNISHSGNLVAVVYGDSAAGVDVERLSRIKDFRKLLRFFSNKEETHILNAKDPEGEFYRVWTFREAFSKKEGVGLSLFEKDPTDIDYEGNAVIYHGARSVFYEYPYPGYRITICAGDGEEKPKLTAADEAWVEK